MTIFRVSAFTTGEPITSQYWPSRKSLALMCGGVIYIIPNIYALNPAEAVMLGQDAQVKMEQLTQILQGPLFSREC